MDMQKMKNCLLLERLLHNLMMQACNELFEKIMVDVDRKNRSKFLEKFNHHAEKTSTSFKLMIIPAKRVRYLAEIAEEITEYNKIAE